MISYFKLLFLFVNLLKFPLKVELNSIIRKEFFVTEGKRRNFILYGVQGPVNETEEQLWKTLWTVLHKTMDSDVTKQEIISFQRLGKEIGNIRPILVKCSTEWRRNQIMGRDFRLRGSPIFIEPDLTKEDLEHRRRNVRRMHELRAEGIPAVVMKGNLMVNGTELTEAPINKTNQLYMNWDGSIDDYYKSTLEFEKKRRNFVLYNIEEVPNETFSTLKKAVLHILNDVIQGNVSMLEIDNMWRLGRPGRRDRPVLVKMMDEWRKKELMSRKGILKGSRIYMLADLPKERVGKKDRPERVRKSPTTTNKWSYITAEHFHRFAEDQWRT